MKFLDKILIYSLWASLGFMAVACEDVVSVDINEGRPQLVIDAWLTNLPFPQEITLSISQPYFENTAPQPALGATVTVTDQNGNVFDFIDEANNGIYIWRTNNTFFAFGEIGLTYNLEVNYQGETYQASSFMNRVPSIDSLITEFREEEVGSPEGYYAEFFARDLEGPGDTYWIRTFKNGELLNQGSDINIAFDAGFSQGGNIDGLVFISPIREGINPFREDDDGEALSPYEVNDLIEIELYSITNEAFNFLEEVRTQLTNEGLFAVPVANVGSNIRNVNPNSPVDVLGFFCTSAVSLRNTRVTE